MRTIRQRLPLFGLLWIAIHLAGCVNIYKDVKPREVEPATAPVRVATPLKVHLADGRVALFPTGAEFSADSLRGVGRVYALDLRIDSLGTPVSALTLDSVVAMETYDEKIRPIESLVVSTLGTAAATLGTSLALVAIFGSCPTIYTGDDDARRLQAEAFPNSIVPLFEMRDVDLLDIQSNPQDTLELEIRNEALETHHINHLELLEVVHPKGTLAIPDNNGLVWMVKDLLAPTGAVDRMGRDVLAPLAAEDSRRYTTDMEVVEKATANDLSDYIDLTITAPSSDSAVVYIRLRNSLLGSVLFYDFMLDGQGANALTWLSRELNSVGGAVKLSSFYKQHMGLRVEVMDAGRYREVTRIREVGPIAFDHVAVPVPVPDADELRIRLRFIADAWRIDRVAVGTLAGRAEARRIPATYVRKPAANGKNRMEGRPKLVGLDQPDLLGQLRRPDEAYAITTPGDRFLVGFPLKVRPADSTRTYLVATQGYYTEWIRGHWVRDDVHGEPFEPTSESLHAALQHWIDVKDDFEDRFEATKIPVR